MTEEGKYGKKFIKDYLRLFDEYSIKNPAYARMLLHVILGQALKHIYFRVGARKIDIRLHLLLIRPSGAGKGAGFGFFSQLAGDLGLNNQVLTEATDAGLVGGVSGYNESGTPQITDGLMKGADMISMEEASPLFDYETAFSKKNLTYLQIAMNPLSDSSCTISKKLGSVDDAIRFKPHCSFLLLTYIPDKFIEALIKRGVIQRFITVMQRVSLDERLTTVDIAIDKLNMAESEVYNERYLDILMRLKEIISNYQKLGNVPKTKKFKALGWEEASGKSEEKKLKTNYKAWFDSLLKENLTYNQIEVICKKINEATRTFEESDYYSKYGYCFPFTDEAKENIRATEHKLIGQINESTMISQEKLSEFTHRIFEILARLSIHHAILRMAMTVENEDVVYAENVYTPIWYSIMYNIEDLLVPTSDERVKMNFLVHRSVITYKKLLDENDDRFVKETKEGKIWVRKRQLLNLLIPQWDNCSYVTAINRFGKIETLDPNNINKNVWFYTKKFGPVPYVKLLQDIA